MGQYGERANKYTGRSSQHMNINGLTVHFYEEAEGPPLLLLHGGAFDSWNTCVDELKDKYWIFD
jgi:pimeloyl-ACP methyl ester carboxylesterase